MSESWEKSHNWYDSLVGEKGHYYHQEIVLPGAVHLLGLSPGASVLDVGCGQGVLARSLPADVNYTGVDISPSLIGAAKKYTYKCKTKFHVADGSKPFLKGEKFSHAAILLALQNMEHPKDVLRNISSLLDDKGKLVIVMNHPCFRIPRQTSWGIDKEKKVQYRRVDRYMEPMEIPIQMHPGGGRSPVQKKEEATFSFHYPISAYTTWLRDSGMAVLEMEEWVSNKVSTGGAAKMENRAREEFPLFLAILSQKLKGLVG